MARDVQSEESKALDQVEHNSDGSAKRVSVRAQDPDSGNWVNIAAIDNGDGTFGLSTAGGGVQYTEGDTDTSITGTALMWEDSSDTMRVASAAKPLPVDIQDSTVAVTQSGAWSVTANAGTNLNTSALALDATLTGGTQKSQIVDSGGEAATVTGGKLDVNATVSLAGETLPISGATEAVGVAIVDGSGDQITSFGGGTQYATNVAYADGNTGTMALSVRDDALSTLTEADGDFSTLRVDSTGRLWANVSNTVTVDGSGVTQPVSNAGLTELAAAINSSKLDVNIVSSDVASGGTSAADDADFTAGTTAGTPAMGVYESSPTSVTDGDLGAVGITSGRRLKTSATVDAALPAGTNNIGDVDVLTVPADPFGANADAAATAGSTGSMQAKLRLVTSQLDAIKTAVELIDNSVDGNYLNVNTNIAGTDMVSGSGTATGALRVELPTNGTGVVGLNAGTNAIGKLAANSGVDIGDVDVTSAVTGTIDHGSNRDIDTAAEQITSTSFAAKFGVTLRADAANTGTLYIGNSDVTAGTTAATDGIPLYPGDSLFIPVTNSNIPYAIASANNQVIYWFAA